jgi:SH3-like domain-containing protein
MKKLLIGLQFSLMLVFTACESSNDVVLNEVESVKKDWASDSRVALFDVKVQFLSDRVLLSGETTIKDAKADLLQRLQEFEIAIVDSIKVLPNQKQKWGITSISVANLRDEPRHAAQLVSQIIMGTPIQILKAKDGWSLIKSPDHYIAWVNNSSIARMDDDAFSHWKSSERCVVIEDCWLHELNGKRISDLVKGSIVAIENMADETLVSLPDGRKGVVKSENVVQFDEWLSEVQLKQDELVKQSMTFMGLPYLWGGTSSKAVDCSGFMKNIYFMSGYVLARDASQQINYGQSIELEIDSLEIGDLLFFGNKEKGKVTHVAMYIGDTEYIHASGRVKINSLDKHRTNYSEYRTVSWLGAQRYIGQKTSEGIKPVSEHSWYVNIN